MVMLQIAFNNSFVFAAPRGIAPSYTCFFTFTTSHSNTHKSAVKLAVLEVIMDADSWKIWLHSFG